MSCNEDCEVCDRELMVDVSDTMPGFEICRYKVYATVEAYEDDECGCEEHGDTNTEQHPFKCVVRFTPFVAGHLIGWTVFGTADETAEQLLERSRVEVLRSYLRAKGHQDEDREARKKAEKYAFMFSDRSREYVSLYRFRGRWSCLHYDDIIACGDTKTEALGAAQHRLLDGKKNRCVVGVKDLSGQSRIYRRI